MFAYDLFLYITSHVMFTHGQAAYTRGQELSISLHTHTCVHMRTHAHLTHTYTLSLTHTHTHTHTGRSGGYTTKHAPGDVGSNHLRALFHNPENPGATG